MASATIAQLRGTDTADGSALLQSLLARPMGGFDPDAWHVMQERDNDLIRSELMHGTANKAFVYSFDIKGTKVNGISVVGARELASQYKGIKSRIVATIEKRGALFIFRTFTPLSIETRHLPDLADEDDFYECVVEVSDIKTGNSIEVRKKESSTERKRDGTTYARPHYDVIAESKAFRNGVLSVLPQSVIRDFQTKCLAAGNTSNEVTVQQLRSQAAAHGAKNGVMLDRAKLADLTFDELKGLGNAAALGLDAFKRSAAALGLIGGGVDQSTGEIPPTTPAPPPPPAQKAAAPAPAADAGADDWQPSAAEQEAIRQRELAEAAGQQQAATTQPAGRRARAAGPATSME